MILAQMESRLKLYCFLRSPVIWAVPECESKKDSGKEAVLRFILSVGA